MSPSAAVTNVSGPKIFLRIPTAALSKKRPASTTAVSESPTTASQSKGSSSSGQKRLKIKLNLRSLSHAPLQQQLQPQPPLRQLAASDRAHKVIIISDDSDTQSDSRKSSLAENHDGTESITATTLTQSVDAENHTCIELDPFLLRVVDTIFPEYEIKSRENLRRAYQVSEKLCDDYIVGRFLGSGSSGFVVSAKRVYDGAEVAIKIIPSDSKYTQSKFKRELDILNALTHENILGFVEYFEAPGFNFLVTDMGGSSLFDFIEAHKTTQQVPDTERGVNHSLFGSSIQENVIRSIFMQLSLAVHALHQNRIVHGDIKDENALITMDNETGTYRARLCDFGHSKRVKHGDPPGFTFYGTTILSPPEMDANNVLREKMKKSDFSVLDEDWQRFYGYEADVFAMGLMLYTMVHGDLPTELTEKNAKALAAYKRRRRSVKTFPFAVLQQDLDNDLKDLLTRMLAVTPSRRITMAEVINHPWLTRTS
ncbi:protein kinase, AMP-activated, alpha 2 catalytic subunit [Haplosporangium sp. Z 767]|nr:protein kinase, AMP-activated, alpha 2 catalytic subunit [Haplosporangium sp. Z 11]KAF9178585.1 protein kinase, AMP-activated, alpha 2 catalytic subunit [Haplosporangium sp. Z 767]